MVGLKGRQNGECNYGCSAAFWQKTSMPEEDSSGKHGSIIRHKSERKSLQTKSKNLFSMPSCIYTKSHFFFLLQCSNQIKIIWALIIKGCIYASWWTRHLSFYLLCNAGMPTQRPLSGTFGLCCIVYHKAFGARHALQHSVDNVRLYPCMTWFSMAMVSLLQGWLTHRLV